MSSNLRPAAAVVLTVIATSAGIWYIHKTQAWEREVRGNYPAPSLPLSCLTPSRIPLELHRRRRVSAGSNTRNRKHQQP